MPEDPNEALRQAHQRLREQTALSDKAATNWTRQSVAAATVLEVFCSKASCLLLSVWKTPQGALAYHQPGYRLAPKTNEETSDPGARRRRTRDGKRRWGPRNGLLSDLGDYPLGFLDEDQVSLGLALACDHLAPYFVSASDLEAWAGRPGAPARRHL